MLNRLAALGRRLLAYACAIVLVAAAAPAAAEPALWVIRDKDSTIYLFGTVHFLRPDTVWRSPKVAKALAESRELVLEVSNLDDTKAVAPLLPTYGIDRANPLSGQIGEKDRERLAAAAKALGVPPAQLEPMRPWLAALTLSVAPLIKAGYDPNSGVERKLMADARASGLPITGFETMEQQIRFFADMPPAVQKQFLSSTLDQIDTTTGQLDRMVDAWQDADLKGLEREFLQADMVTYRPLYETLVANRNRAWADLLKAKLAGSGVSFVAVGAGHLVGPDSVQVELKKRGINAVRQ